MTTSQLPRVNYYAARGFGVADIARLTGVPREEVRAYLRPERERKSELSATAIRLLKRVPPGRTASEHLRIVFANFGDVLVANDGGTA